MTNPPWTIKHKRGKLVLLYKNMEYGHVQHEDVPRVRDLWMCIKGRYRFVLIVDPVNETATPSCSLDADVPEKIIQRFDEMPLEQALEMFYEESMVN